MEGQDEHGTTLSMKYAVADITVALDSVSQICDSGAKVVFEKHGGYVLTPAGTQIPFGRKDDTYFRTVWVVDENLAKTSDFPGQRPTSS